jgi:hypothetical protein
VQRQMSEAEKAKVRGPGVRLRKGRAVNKVPK